MRHQSDKYPGFRNLECPRHGSGWDIREKLRSLGPSVPPMLNALLTDKSLHDTRCTCHEAGNKRPSHSNSSDALNLPGTVSHQRSWNTERVSNGDQNLQCFPDSSFSSYDATMIINGTMTMNGSLRSDEADDDDQNQLRTSPRVQGGSNRLMHHSLDCEEKPSLAKVFNHNQSNSDSAAEKIVSSEC